jgi:hypothetical protein
MESFSNPADNEELQKYKGYIYYETYIFLFS